MALTRYELTHVAKPLLMNAERRMHHHARAAVMREWRQVFHTLAVVNRVPPCARVGIDVVHTVVKGKLPDAGACFPAVKAAVDGIVDAGVLPDDGPECVAWIRFHAPRKTGVDSVTLIISNTEEGNGTEQPSRRGRHGDARSTG